LKKKGALPPEQEKAVAAEIEAELARQPKFSVPFARHIPGQGRAEAIGAMVMGEIRRPR
jgi:hypothetical protein